LRQGDLELARRAAGGDRSAFHAVVDRHAQSLFRLARGMVSSREDAEDIVQETFVEALKGIGSFDGRSSLMTWLTRILFRRAGRVWKKNRRARSVIPLEAASESPRLHDRPVSMSATADVDHKLDLAAVLPTLAPEHRQILLLREMQGMSYAEIASTLRVPQGTVESRLHRARRELRDRLKAYWTDEK
jgi:RNA polymerase sigma-70 factor (ECF subfamily)